MTRRRFESLVAEAVMLIPRRFRREMKNLALIVEDEPSSELLAQMDIEPPDTLLGYFEEEKLNVKIQPGGPNIDGVAIVASGRYEIGQVSSSPSLMLAASQKIPVTCKADRQNVRQLDGRLRKVGFQIHSEARGCMPLSSSQRNSPGCWSRPARSRSCSPVSAIP